MADLVHWRASLSYSCCAFVHLGKFSQLVSRDSVYSAILLDSTGCHVVTGVLMLSGQKAVNQPVNWSSDAFDVSNGHAASTAFEVIRREQDIYNVSAWSEDCRLCRVQFMMPMMKVLVLKMNAQLAGCIAKTLTMSSKFAHSFIKYARCCAWKHAVLPVYNAYFTLDTASALDHCSDTASSQHTPSLAVSIEETMQNTVLICQTVIIVMTAPHRVEIDYLWYDCTID